MEPDDKTWRDEDDELPTLPRVPTAAPAADPEARIDTLRDPVPTFWS